MPRDTNKELTSKDYTDALEELGYCIRMNKCNDVIEVNGEPISDPLEAEMRTRMRDLGFKQMPVLTDAYTAHARKNAYHPIKDYLWGLDWDGRDHIGRVCEHIQDEHNVFSLWFRKWLIGSCAKVCNDGAMNPMLVLDGAQDIGKSLFVEWLASGVDKRYFVSSHINLDDKDDLLRLISKWIWEVGELGSTIRRTDRESLKQFLSQTSVTVRKPYGHNDMVKPAMASFIGTVNNESGILSDPTGSRRFIVCKVTSLDWGYEDVPIDGVWAQAMRLFKDGESHKLSADEKIISRNINEQYEIENPIQDMLEKYFEIDLMNSEWWTPSVDVLEHLSRNGWKDTHRASQMALAAAMTKLGIQKVKRYNALGRYVNGYLGLKPSSNLPL